MILEIGRADELDDGGIDTIRRTCLLFRWLCSDRIAAPNLFELVAIDSYACASSAHRYAHKCIWCPLSVLQICDSMTYFDGCSFRLCAKMQPIVQYDCYRLLFTV